MKIRFLYRSENKIVTFEPVKHILNLCYTYYTLTNLRPVKSW